MTLAHFREQLKQYSLAVILLTNNNIPSAKQFSYGDLRLSIYAEFHFQRPCFQHTILHLLIRITSQPHQNVSLDIRP